MAPPFLGLQSSRPVRRRTARPDLNNKPRRPGRPRLSASDLRRHKLKRLKALSTAMLEEEEVKTVKTKSALEYLPVELIHQIFFYCLEVNLVLASPYFMHALSDAAIYKSLILLAFFDDDEYHPVERKHFLPASYRFIDIREKLTLQKSVLRCRWCTSRLITECLPALTRLKIVQEWFAEKERIKPYHVDDRSDRVILERKEVAVLPDLDDYEALMRHFFADRNEFDVGLNVVSANPNFPRIITWSYTVAGKEKIRKSLGTSTSILAARHVPTRLLLGAPWTQEKIHLLQLLRQGHRFIQSAFWLDISPDHLFKGMANAIEEDNDLALITLLELHYAAFRRDRFTVDDLRPHQQLFTVPFSHPIPTKIFHLAAKQSTNPSKTIATLLREGIDSVPRDDPILTSWAIRARSSGDKVATWLLKHMEGTQNYGLGGRDSPLFINGELNPRRADGQYPFTDRSFTAELGYITHGAIAFIPQNPQEVDIDD